MINDTFILSALVATGALLYAGYLSYYRLHEAKRKVLVNKYKSNSSGYRIYQKIYSRQFAIAWAFFTLGAVVNVAFSSLRLVYRPPHLIMYSGLMAPVILSLVAFYMTIDLFKKH